MEIHGTLLVAFQVHPEVEPFTENLPVPAGPETLLVVGESVSEQAAPDCVRENVWLPIFIVPDRGCAVGFDPME